MLLFHFYFFKIWFLDKSCWIINLVKELQLDDERNITINHTSCHNVGIYFINTALFLSIENMENNNLMNYILMNIPVTCTVHN